MTITEIVPFSSTDAGRVGESAVLHKLATAGWYPFVDISGKCPVDILAWKDGETIRLQVKSTTVCKNGSWIVSIGSIRPSRTGNAIHKFDSASADYLAVYISPIDKVAFVPCSEITSGRSIAIREIGGGRAKARILSDYEVI